MRTKLWIVLMAGLILLVGLAPAEQAENDEDELRTYIELSTENQLLAADHKLGEILQSPDPSLDPEQRQHLQQAREQCREALRQYAYSSSEDELLLTDDWWAHFNPASPGDPTYPDVSGSPLSLLAHLYLAHYSAEQQSARAMISGGQYTAAQERLLGILDESVDLMQQALESAELGTGYKVQGFADSRVFFELPLDYTSQSTSYATPVSTVKRLPDGTLQRAVLVNRVDAQHTIAPRDFAEARHQELIEKFPDLSDWVVEEAEGDGYEVRALFGFTYTWERDGIKALIYSQKSGELAYELNCLALAEHFDRAECDRIIRSLIRQ
jgi:hypothetical protein